MSSFPLQIEKNIQAMKISRFSTVAANPRSKKSSMSPRLQLRRDQPTSRFWSSFIEIEVMIEEQYLSYATCIAAFCSDVNKRYCMFLYIFLRNKILLLLEWRQKPTRAIIRYSSVVNMEKGNFTNFRISWKINENSCTTMIVS